MCKLVKSRKIHRCVWCGQEIKKGARYYASKWKGSVSRMHQECYTENEERLRDDPEFYAYRNERPTLEEVAVMYYIGELTDFDFDERLEAKIKDEDDAMEYLKFITEEFGWHSGALEKAKQLLEKFS